MIEIEYLSIAEFAKEAGVSKQAIYKQINNPNSQIAPFIVREGKRVLLNKSALRELYGVELNLSTISTTTDDKETTFTTQKDKGEVEKETPATEKSNQENQPINHIEPKDNPVSTPSNQPISTDYIDFLKAQIAELKEEKVEVERRLNATIQEKDGIIKDQTAQLAQLAQQVAEIANKALITTSQQQYLTASERAEKQDPPAGDVIIETPATIEPKKGFWKRLFK